MTALNWHDFIRNWCENLPSPPLVHLPTPGPSSNGKSDRHQGQTLKRKRTPESQCYSRRSLGPRSELHMEGSEGWCEISEGRDDIETDSPQQTDMGGRSTR